MGRKKWGIQVLAPESDGLNYERGDGGGGLRHNTTASLRSVIFESARLHRAPQLSYSFPTLLADADHTFSMIVFALSV